MQPSEPPRYISALTHDFSETVNGPDGSGESFDSRTNRLADGHPNTAPNPICKILTKLQSKFLFSFNFIILSLANYITLPVTVARNWLRTSLENMLEYY